MTNHLEFARRVATLLLTYDAGTDFAMRNSDLLRAAAPTPYGNPTGLADTLAAYTPTGAGLNSIRTTNTTVTVSLSEVAVSDWAAPKLAARGASSGVYGIDITATQTISTRNAAPTQVPVRMGLTVACPPAVEFCTLAGVFPQFVEDALGPDDQPANPGRGPADHRDHGHRTGVDRRRRGDRRNIPGRACVLRSR